VCVCVCMFVCVCVCVCVYPQTLFPGQLFNGVGAPVGAMVTGARVGGASPQPGLSVLVHTMCWSMLHPVPRPHPFTTSVSVHRRAPMLLQVAYADAHVTTFAR
jgi:hypothetical protein